MKTIIDSIRLQINERLSSPLFGTFLASWIAWNHRLLVVLFSDLKVADKFSVIDTQLYPSGWVVWRLCLLWPAVSSILFIFFYPVISKLFYGYWLKKQRELKELRDKIEAATLLTQEESHAIRMSVIRLKNEYEETISRQSREIETLKNNALQASDNANKQKDLEEIAKRQSPEIAQMRAQLDELLRQSQDKSSERKPAIDKGTIELIGLLSKSNGQSYKSSVYNHFSQNFKDSPVRVDYYIDEAMRHKLVHTQYEGNDVWRLSLTEGGRRFAVQQGFV